MSSVRNRLLMAVKKRGIQGSLKAIALELRRVSHKIRKTLRPEDAYLRKVLGLIHVGANTGEERDLYCRYNLDVIWIEAIPEVFEQLRSRLDGYPKQKAYQYLIADSTGREYVFHVANNQGASSSLLPLAKHRQMWP